MIARIVLNCYKVVQSDYVYTVKKETPKVPTNCWLASVFPVDAPFHNPRPIPNERDGRCETENLKLIILILLSQLNA
jgi:hypothetical protein